MTPANNITALQYIRNSFGSMTEFQQQEFLSKLGVDNIDMVDPKMAEAYCRNNNIQITKALANNSAFVAATSNEIRNNATAKYKAASDSWDLWHEQLNLANKTESISVYNRDKYYAKAMKQTNENGEVDKTSTEYKKYMTFKTDTENAQSLFRRALSGEQMAVQNMNFANRLFTISLFGQQES